MASPAPPAVTPPRTVLVTGAGKRLGREIALTLASAGWHVAVHQRHSVADARQTAADCDALTGRPGSAATFFADLSDETSVRDEVRQLHARLAEPLIVDGFPVTVGVSIGVASAPDDALTPRDLMHGADVAMYKAKRTGSAIELYDNCERGPQRREVRLRAGLQAHDDEPRHRQFP